MACGQASFSLSAAHLDSFDQMEFEYQRNQMQGTFDFVALEARLLKIKEQLVASPADSVSCSCNPVVLSWHLCSSSSKALRLWS